MWYMWDWFLSSDIRQTLVSTYNVLALNVDMESASMTSKKAPEIRAHLLKTQLLCWPLESSGQSTSPPCLQVSLLLHPCRQQTWCWLCRSSYRLLKVIGIIEVNPIFRNICATRKIITWRLFAMCKWCPCHTSLEPEWVRFPSEWKFEFWEVPRDWKWNFEFLNKK